MVAIFAVLVIAYLVFPNVDANRGGGRPTHAVIFFTKEGEDITASIMNQDLATDELKQHQNALSAYVVYANSQYFLLQFDFATAAGKSKKPVEIDRRLINAYIPDDGPVQARPASATPPTP